MMSLLFSFAGRIGRGGFWLGVLAQVILTAIGFGIAMLFGGMGAPTELALDAATEGIDLATPSMNVTGAVSLGIASLASLWVGLATGVKRAHDRGKSGWWLLLLLVPLAGFIWWLVDLGILEGDEGANRFGPVPV